MTDEELRHQIIKDMVGWAEAIRWSEYRVLGNNNGGARLFRGSMGAYVIGITQRGDNISASIRCDITQTIVICNDHLTKNFYELALVQLKTDEMSDAEFEALAAYVEGNTCESDPDKRELFVTYARRLRARIK